MYMAYCCILRSRLKDAMVLRILLVALNTHIYIYIHNELVTPSWLYTIYIENNCILIKSLSSMRLFNWQNIVITFSLFSSQTKPACKDTQARTGCKYSWAHLARMTRSASVQGPHKIYYTRIYIRMLIKIYHLLPPPPIPTPTHNMYMYILIIIRTLDYAENISRSIFASKHIGLRNYMICMKVSSKYYIRQFTCLMRNFRADIFMLILA